MSSVTFASIRAVARRTFWELDAQDGSFEPYVSTATGCRARSFSDTILLDKNMQVSVSINVDEPEMHSWRRMDPGSVEDDATSQCSEDTVSLTEESDDCASSHCEFICDSDCCSSPEDLWSRASMPVFVAPAMPQAVDSASTCALPCRYRKRGCRGGRSTHVRRSCRSGRGHAESCVQQMKSAGVPDLQVKSQDTISTSADSASSNGELPSETSPGEYTTLVFKNTTGQTRLFDLCELLDAESFAGQYNFVYMPANFRTMNSFGFTFVNFEEHAVAERAKRHFHNFRWIIGTASMMLSVEWSIPHQGVDVMVERFRNCPVMHKLVPREFKPIILQNGVEVEFPPPTTCLIAPRQFRQ